MSCMPHHREHSHVILMLKPAHTFSYSFSWYCICHITNRTCSRLHTLLFTIFLAVRVATSPIALAHACMHSFSNHTKTHICLSTFTHTHLTFLFHLINPILSLMCSRAHI